MPKKIVNFVLCVLCVLGVDLGYCLNLDKVKVYFLSGDYKSAILEGEKIMAVSGPYSAGLDELYYILGLSYLKDANFLRASDIFEIILNEFKDSGFVEEARLGLGDTYFLRGDFIRAESYYQELINSNPRTELKPQVYYRLSQIGFKKGDTGIGREYADKLKDNFPLNPELRLNKNLYILADSTSDVYYTVQVGSFSNSTNARNLTRELTQKGFPAYIEETNFGRGGITYRVRVGKFHSRQEAIELENKLSAGGYPTKIFP